MMFFSVYVRSTYKGAHTSRKKPKNTDVAKNRRPRKERKNAPVYYDIRVRGTLQMEDKRSVYKGLILYPENSEHMKALDKIKHTFVYKAILHDKDIDENNKPKKPHYHIIVKLSSTQTNKYLADTLNIPVNYIQVINSLKGAYDYLTHRYTENKFQYDNIELFGDLTLENDDVIEGDFICILKSIKENKITSMYELTQWCIANNCLGTLRKNAYLISLILKSSF